ncbi:aminotransferase class I/II-fold pyridoxal phosphate-dependent enzyme, partial [Corynebacterium amycolatum]|uniref:aminotransferase class I/II-fold pyridoxal phosphate-dependent enzyme n=1 Tax=Corynebacterium amycolatum TaxID=43765 RepID=UPI00211A99FD
PKRPHLTPRHADSRHTFCRLTRNIAPPDGGFYIYANIAGLYDDPNSVDSMTWARELLAATGVAVAPGIDFDTENGHEWVRLCFAGETSEMEEAIRRIGVFTGRG